MGQRGPLGLRRSCLIGPPGSGKSSVAAAVGRSTGLPVRDTDTDVERCPARTITDIFTQDGEAVFRELELAAVMAALAEHRGVLALGGGAILADESPCASFSPAVGWCS